MPVRVNDRRKLTGNNRIVGYGGRGNTMCTHVGPAGACCRVVPGDLGRTRLKS